MIRIWFFASIKSLPFRFSCFFNIFWSLCLRSCFAYFWTLFLFLLLCIPSHKLSPPVLWLHLLFHYYLSFHSNLDVSLSRQAPLIIQVDFDLLLCFCNFPWLLLASSSSSNCVLFCFALQVFSLDIMNKSVFLLMFPVVLSELLFDS